MAKDATCTECDGAGGIEARHPSWGSSTCPEAYVQIPCKRCDGSGTIPLAAYVLDLLIEVEAFLDDQADAEILDNGRMVPNEAMRIRELVTEAIKELEEDET